MALLGIARHDVLKRARLARQEIGLRRPILQEGRALAGRRQAMPKGDKRDLGRQACRCDARPCRRLRSP